MTTRGWRPASRAAVVATGALVAWLPTVGPFVALFAVIGARVRLRGSDALWWLAAVALGLPWIAAGEVVPGLLAVGKVIVAWLLFLGAERVRSGRRDAQFLNDAGTGLLLGLLGVTLSGIARIEAVDLTAASRLTQTIAWREHPTLFAHSLTTLSALVAINAAGPRRSLLALTLGAVGVLAAGALEAAVGWLLVATAVTVAQRARPARLAHAALVALVAVLVAGAGAWLGLGRSGLLVELQRGAPPRNLLQGTEVPHGDWWFALGVGVANGTVRLDGADLVTYRLAKVGEPAWSRLQQRNRLDPGLTTVSVYLRPEPGTRPGIDLWARLGSGDDAVELNAYATWRDGGEVRSTARGPIAIVSARLLDVDERAAADGWVRLALTVAYAGPSHEWYVGVTPDRVTGSTASTTFAGLQAERGAVVGAYAPAAANRGLDLRTARAQVWSDAVAAIRAAPWFGWGPHGFRRAIDALYPSDAAQRLVPAHAHQAFLDAWVEGGVVRFAGLLVLCLALVRRTARRRDLLALSVVAAVVVMNLFDSTLLFGGVLYPLAVLLGWRSGAQSKGRGRDFAAAHAGPSFALALGDLAAAAVAFATVALLAAQSGGGVAASPAVTYAMLLWPLLAWWRGLYPGYGSSPQNELRRSVQAAATAGLAVVAGAVLIPGVIALPIGHAVAWALATTFMAPILRALVKRLLLALGAWGRPVVVIGGGEVVRRVVDALGSRPLDGLRPVAVFTDDAAAADGSPPAYAVPVRGRVADAVPFARTENVTHAVVALPEGDPERLQALVTSLTRAFPRVQFLPNLAAMPSHGVVATDLDHLLALELRVGLLDPGNRALKRMLDYALVALGAVAAAPLVAVLAALVRWDTPGPVFYSQERIGRGGRRFRMWKFRTMVRDADRVLAGLLERDPALRAEWDAHQKLADDPRVTRVGRWLRRTSLDELPQLWNVLRGEMSIVGPRPIVQDEVDHYGSEFETFATVPPGITGYWQVSGRSRVPYPERVELDAYYVRNWSIWLDLVILARTVGVVVRREGAY